MSYLASEASVHVLGCEWHDIIVPSLASAIHRMYAWRGGVVLLGPLGLCRTSVTKPKALRGLETRLL